MAVETDELLIGLSYNRLVKVTQVGRRRRSKNEGHEHFRESLCDWARLGDFESLAAAASVGSVPSQSGPDGGRLGSFLRDIPRWIETLWKFISNR